MRIIRAVRAFRIRIGLPYLLAALFLIPALGALATLIYSRQGGPPFALAMPLAQIPMVFVSLFFLGGSVGEEFGWAYAIDAMLQKWRPLASAATLGVIWGCWHLPLFFIPGMSQSRTPLWGFLIFTVSSRIMFVWAYERSRKSILTTLLFHTSANAAPNIFLIIGATLTAVYFDFITLLAIAAAAIAALSPLYRSVRETASA